MKKYINNLCMLFISAICLSFVMGSCNETWDNHYMQDETSSKELLLTKIKASSDLSTFVDLLKKAGYDSVLTYPQAYTVFAPVNAALAKVSPDTLNNPALLKVLLGNHICRFSYSTIDANSNLRIKMLSGKYEEFILSGGKYTFAGIDLLAQDELSKNGILHKIGSVARIKPNIWNYMQNSNKFPSIMSYLTPYNTMVFDEFNSVAIGKNTLGQIVYDSVFVASNRYFKVIGDLNSEEKQFTYLGLPDNVYTGIFQNFKSYFAHPVADTVTRNTTKAIIDNLVVPAISKNSLTGGNLLTSTGKLVAVAQSDVSQEIKLSNGNMFVMNALNLEPTKIMYKPNRYEVENTAGIKIGKTADFSIQKIYSGSASGNFINQALLIKDPDATNSNSYFEVSFSNVLSAKYDIYIKFAPVGASKSTKLKYVLSYKNFDGTTTTTDIPGGIVSNVEDSRIKIGSTYNFPVYVNNYGNDSYFVKLKVIVDVSNAELILYDRTFGIDYIELVPVP